MNTITTKHEDLLDLLQYIIRQPNETHTDLLICSTKEDFLHQILIGLDQDHGPTRVATGHEVEVEDDINSRHKPDHILLSKALYVLNASQHVQLIFCSTLTVLRGYLSCYTPQYQELSKPHDTLTILNLLALHHGTSEFTLQGLSQTFATAISAAHRTNRALKLVECKDIRDPTNLNRGPALWQAEVQLLSAAIKIGQAGQNWGRRTISVAKIASRWFAMDDSKHTWAEKKEPIPVKDQTEDEMLL